MKKYIMIRCVLLCVAVVLISGLTSAAILQYSKEQDVVKNMRDILTAISLRDNANPGEELDYEALAKTYTHLSFDYRVTILDAQGNVLGDSNFDSATMENHADRPEIRQALVAGTGYEKRSSETYGRQMVYVALRNGPLIYRIAAPMERINATIVELIPALLVGLLLALIISPILARRVAASITHPLDCVVDSLEALGSGNYENKLEPSELEELQPIVSTVNTLTKQISHAVGEVRQQKEKTGYLLDNMIDGLVLVDHDMRILQINAAARRFLSEERELEGKNLLMLTHQPRVIEAVSSALKSGASTLFDMQQGGGPGAREDSGQVLSVHITAVQSDWMSGGKQNGAVLLISDVTRERRAEQMRREFVANASHELKTPITSIGGFAELLATGVVREEAQVQDYLGRICAETQRMAALINDILRLSRLESGEDGAQPPRVHVALEPLTRNILANLGPQMEARGIVAQVEVQDAEEIVVFAEQEDMETLLTNLVDNAVKYNKEQGSITVSLRRSGIGIRLAVRDTGTGIPAECQPRIFERFYRADKGRSRKVGGTGLGLAIVKHITAKYGGEIRLKSTESVGTEITVLLPCGAQKKKRETAE